MAPVFSVVEAVHAHYVPALMQYGSLERQTLNIALQSISMVSCGLQLALLVSG